jgi:hypothetical protein
MIEVQQGSAMDFSTVTNEGAEMTKENAVTKTGMSVREALQTLKKGNKRRPATRLVTILNDDISHLAWEQLLELVPQASQNLLVRDSIRLAAIILLEGQHKDIVESVGLFDPRTTHEFRRQKRQGRSKEFPQ